MQSAKQRFGESFDAHKGKVSRLPNSLEIREEFCRFTPKKQATESTFMDAKEIAKIERNFEGKQTMRVKFAVKKAQLYQGKGFTFRDARGNILGTSHIKTNKIW